MPSRIVQLGCLGLGVVRPAQTAVLGGTFWQQVVNLAAPVTDPEMNVRVNPHVIPGMVQAESISFFTGLTMRWFRDAFCAEEKLIAERLGIDTYTLLEEMASRVPPGSWGVMPIFSDRMRFKTWYHAAPSFINLSIDPDKCNKATLFRALEENAAIVSACNLQQIADFSNIHPSSLVFAGGGSKGKLWSQILADVSGLPVNIPVVKEATALGCAIAAGVGAGIFSSMAETGERLVRWEGTHTPAPEKHELYQDSRDKWQAVYQDQLGLVDHGLTTSLWKAPGL
ncbi:autoinducer-2 (AI-2) kinase [Escherichia coli ECA-0157]|nr:autoinducer-2 (AI-2) kinase [Escherichia coli ECA-0157]